MIIDGKVRPSFSFQNRLARALWGICAALFFRLSPRPLHGWRIFLLRCWGSKFGAHCRVYPSTSIWAPWNLKCGNGVIIAGGVELYNQDLIEIGDGTVVSQGTCLCTGTHDYTRPEFPLYTRPIHLGERVWIAARCFVHPGVTIGEGAVVGACSVVTKDLPPWMVCAGHPCRPVKPRAMVLE